MDSSRNSARQQEVMKVAEQAAEWLVTLEEGDRKEFPALAEWLKESPLHVEMFLRMAAVERLTDAVGEEDRQRVRSEIETNADRDVVTRLASSLPSTIERKTSGWKHWGIGIAATAAAAGALWWMAPGQSANDLSTAIGEQRSVSLPDGSVLYLNADSRVEVVYSKSQRSIRLVSGEALFKVQHDPVRPFRVQVGNVVVQALGTQFNIYRRPTQTEVAVIEGSVQIEQTAPLPALTHTPQRLTAGEGVVLRPDAEIGPREPIDTAQVTAWRARRLIFRWAKLETIVEEFNRYNSSPQIRVHSSELRERRYTAVFDADAPRELLKFLERDESVRVAAEGDELIIRPR